MKELLAKIRGIFFIFKCRICRKNIIIDNGLKLYCKLDIKGKGKIIIGKNVAVRGIPGSRNQYVTLYTHSPDALLKIGDNVQLLAAKISCKFFISIGNSVIIEDSSILDTDFHSLDVTRGDPPNETKEKCQIIIADNVWIATRSIITKGVKIAADSVVFPCSVVNGSFPSKSHIFGNPAKKIRQC